MSRGPGRWQRVLLDALTTHDLGTVGTIAENHLGRPASRSEMVAVRRAARRLAETGCVQALHLGECRRCGELSETWQCTKCGGGCGEVLAVARTQLGGIRSVASLGKLPEWVSVALVPNQSEATLRNPK